MLAEFFLTPEAFADLDGDNGTKILDELQECLVPSLTTPVGLVCQLGGKQWVDAASKLIAKISDTNKRNKAMSLFGKIIDSICVTRPLGKSEADGEAEWIAAGRASHKIVPFAALVVSRHAAPPDGIGLPIEGILRAEFWENFGNPRLVARSIEAQKRVLTAICAHSDWLVIRLPQIRGGNDDEIVTAKQIIELADNVVPAFREAVTVHVHACEQKNITADRLARLIKDELSETPRRGASIVVSIWPEKHFLNRELLAGVIARTSSPGEIVPKPLWLVKMEHVAVKYGNPRQLVTDENAWSLFPRKKACEWFHQLTADEPITKISIPLSVEESNCPGHGLTT